MPNHRTNKTIAGYHLLMILSAVDRRYNAEEDKVIKDFLLAEFPFRVNLDKQMEIISALAPEDRESHFLKYMDDFYDDATPQERHKFLQFAINLVKADSVITVEENHYLQILFDHWDMDGNFR